MVLFSSRILVLLSNYKGTPKSLRAPLSVLFAIVYVDKYTILHFSYEILGLELRLGFRLEAATSRGLMVVCKGEEGRGAAGSFL